ncbi:putative Fe-S protein [Roseibacterium elongatum DSM 19469]|uniref:Putative Fe-S protein n=1 Tax=Roseicyclus elongatus DSM 19469 TaxID=1294273 RepID=W8RTJ8_9RHOB|nr:putative Fe-S protein [Roseibacterium elongatum DSM 19469]
MGLTVRRLHWQGDELLDEVEARFASASGSFVAGVHGAAAEVLRAPDEAFEAQRNGAVLTLRTGRAALRLEAAVYLTAFEIQRADGAPLIALAVPSGRARLAAAHALTDLGPDDDNLLARDAGGHRFDVGLGRRAARFTLRCPDDLARAIAPHCGTPWPDCMGRIDAAVLAASPVRVVEAPCLRAEVDTEMTPPGGTPPDGPHTRLTPDDIAQGVDTPPSVPLPEDYALSALFYPA